MSTNKILHFLSYYKNTITRIISTILSIVIIILFIYAVFNSTINAYTFSGLLLGTVCFLLGLVILNSGLTKSHIIWALFNIAGAFWAAITFFIGQQSSSINALVWWKIAILGMILVSILFYHTIHDFCRIRKDLILKLFYAQGILFLCINFSSDLMVRNVTLRFNQFYYLDGTRTFTIFLSIWIFIIVYSFVILKMFFSRSSGLRRIQTKYLLIGTMIGWLGSATNAFLVYGIKFYPVGNYFVCIYAAISTYAILKYQLMDIRVAFSRIGIFVLVYTIVLGIPFGVTFWGKEILINVFGQHWYWVPIVLSTVFATAGPFIYIFIQRKAEDQLLREERRINHLLTQASYGMTSIRHLSRLFSLVIELLSKILRVEKAQLFILNQTAGQYELKAPDDTKCPASINDESALVTELMRRKYPIVYDEIRSRAEGNHSDKHPQEVLAQMDEISCHVVVPIVIETNLMGFITLGDRKTKEIYSNELLNALAVFGNQTALALQNCYFLEAEEKRWEEESLMERRRSLDHLVASMAHEIDNPMTMVRGQTEVVQMYIKDPRVEMPDEIRKIIDGAHAFVFESQERVSGMVKAIERYSKQAPGALIPMKITEAEADYWKLSGKSFGLEHIKYTRDVADNLPYILGDSIQLMEVFMNFAENSRHAVSKVEVKQVKLKIFQKNKDWIRIEFSDTGSGIEKKLLKDVFLPYVTTKGSSEGTGMGLHHVRRIIQLHKGHIWAESEGKNKGSTMVVEFPVYKGEIKDDKSDPENKMF